MIAQEDPLLHGPQSAEQPDLGGGMPLLADTSRRLGRCLDRVARDSVGVDEDGAAVVHEAPLQPNPVTQDEVDAGSIERF